MKELLLAAIVAVVAVGAASCTSLRPAGGATAYGCKLPPEKARELATRACYDASSAGVVMCTPSAPAVAAVMACVSAANGMKMGKLSIDPARMEQSGTATQNVSSPVVMPSGEVAAVAACEISRRHKQVVYAVLTRGPTNQAEADYLRGQGACAD